MATTYLVAFINKDRHQWKTELQSAIGAATYRHVGNSGLVGFVEPEKADLVLYLGSEALAADQATDTEVKQLLARGTRCIPIVDGLENFKEQTVPALSVVNGLSWGNPVAIAEEVLRHLGLAERDRRVFLSYLRRETTELAHQLYDELHRRGFFVFLDSFEIEHGAVVQDRIEQALHETSFVLLIYSPAVRSFGWIEKEINFALTHRLGLLGLALPGSAKTLPFGMTPADKCYSLAASDLNAEARLTNLALERICIHIEEEHADQFRNRRDRMLFDISAALQGRTHRVGGHSLRYDGKRSSTLMRINPRSPQTRDLYMLDRDCPAASTTGHKTLRRVLVASKGGYKENRELTEWACAELKHEVDWLEPEQLCSDPSIIEEQ